MREGAQLGALLERELEKGSFSSETELEERSFSEKRIEETCSCKRMMGERPF